MEHDKNNERAAFLDQREIDQTLMNIVTSGFLADNLMQASIGVVNECIDDQRLQNPELSFIVKGDDNNEYLDPHYHSKRAIQQFNQLCNGCDSYQALFDAVEHIFGNQPKNASGVTLHNPNNNTSLRLGETLVHLIIQGGHFRLLEKLVDELHLRDTSVVSENILVGLLKIKNDAGQNVRVLMDLDQIEKNPMISDDFKAKLLSAANSVKLTKPILNDQKETKSCKLVQNPTFPVKDVWISQLHLYTLNQDLGRIALSLKQGMNPNIKCFSGSIPTEDEGTDAPIHWWVGSENPYPNEEVLKLLLKYGCNIDQPGAAQRTALQAAIAFGGGFRSQNYVPLLLKHGASLTEQDLYEYLLFVYNTNIKDDLPLSQLHVRDYGYMFDNATLPCFAEVFKAILLEKQKNPNGKVNALELLKLHGAFSDLSDQVPQPAKVLEHDITDVRLVQQENEPLNVNASTQQNSNKPDPEDKKVVHSAQGARSAFDKSSFGQWINKELKQLALTHPNDGPYKTPAGSVIHDAIEHINSLIDKSCSLDNMAKLAKEIHDYISDDILKRPDIQKNEGLKACLLNILGGLLYWTKLFMGAKTSERFDGYFFKSHASYDLTAFKQDIEAKNNSSKKP